MTITEIQYKILYIRFNFNYHRWIKIICSRRCVTKYKHYIIIYNPNLTVLIIFAQNRWNFQKALVTE